MREIIRFLAKTGFNVEITSRVILQYRGSNGINHERKRFFARVTKENIDSGWRTGETRTGALRIAFYVVLEQMEKK